MCNDLADQIGYFRRHGMGVDVIDARMFYAYACRSWYPVFRDLHRFFAIAGAIVNDDGRRGTAQDPLVWCSGARVKRWKVMEGLRELAILPGPQRLWASSWHKWPDIAFSVEDVGRWPFSLGVLVHLASFLSSLFWQEGRGREGV